MNGNLASTSIEFLQFFIMFDEWKPCLYIHWIFTIFSNVWWMETLLLHPFEFLRFFLMCLYKIKYQLMWKFDIISSIDTQYLIPLVRIVY
jgi:hypothetical protein